MAREKDKTKRWGWAVGALIAVFVAVAMTSRTAPKISFFRRSNKPCNCTQETHKFTGIVEDCCCDYETVDHINKEVLHPSLQELVKTPFFRYFKVKLWCDCPFGLNDGMCRLRDCSVCECPDSEFPESFKKPHHGLPLDDLVCQEGKPEAAVDRTLDKKAFRGWTEIDNPWTNDDETDNAEMTYVNLQLNPERYTGYTGPSSRRIWDAVYAENCPKYPSEELCAEERILYKLISGLHSSISVHLASDYLLDETTQLWGPNLPLMYDRVLRYPDRVRNLYFTFLFVLRAVTKAADYLEHAEYDTGNLNDDLKTQSFVRQLLYNPNLQAACPVPFDEAKLWKGQRGPELKQKIQNQFRNISALMDCVGCEKCRLWGKLQVLGLGTALKILFSVDGQQNIDQTLHLQRNEVIALMNLLNRLSESLKFVNEMGPSTERLVEGQISPPTAPGCPIQRMWASIWNTAASGQISPPTAPGCPIQRMWASIWNTAPSGQISPPTAPGCPIQRMWASIWNTAPSGQISPPIAPSCPIQRMWASIWYTAASGQISPPTAPSCPIQRMWASIWNRAATGQISPPTAPGCPIQRMWASMLNTFNLSSKDVGPR